MFEDRIDAGVRLAERLSAYRGAPNAVVLGIPRGGVVVAAEVARVLDLPLDVAVAAKVGAPGNPEYAIGAMGPDGVLLLNSGAGFSREEVMAQADAARQKVARATEGFRQGREPLNLTDAVVLLVDDGLATGLTARAAAEWLRRQRVARLIVAVPVASASAVAYLSEVADEVIADDVPEGFFAVGQFYRRFEQTTDGEVRDLLGLNG